ncbi:MAG: apolipoprotein N-acyltransferase [Proteobacteria bacterium]|nr:apolipoprotein N-acyltransferase [Pseudomonadota bacterium]MCL2306934.1 apolipoprotein N-acyltransferase [Pseudomonadota bacterium]
MKKYYNCGTALLLGALTVPAFLPAEVLPGGFAYLTPLLPILSLAGLIALWQRVDAPRTAFALGFAYGLGLFGGGIHWIYIALTTFGGMATWVAVLFMVLLIAYMALYPALVGYLAVRFFTGGARLLTIPALWGLSELLRAHLFSGLPWLSMGYTQALPSPLAGMIPVGGVYLASVVCVALSAAFVQMVWVWRAHSRKKYIGAIAALLLLMTGHVLNNVEWSEPAGEPLPVSLIQGNIAQDIKFDPAFIEETYARYRRLAETSRGRLVVLPESAFPDFADQVPEEEVIAFTQLGIERQADFLVGMFTRRVNISGRDEYFNSVLSLGQSPLNLYRKRHLVPFGEKIPFESIVAPLMNALIAIPLAGQSEGAADQPPFSVAGEKVAITICFEDVFGAEQIRSARQATLLANFTNDAWYGRSMAAWQHHRIATMRALETARPMLRATNTGITAVIDHRGRVVNHLPWFTTDILEAEIAGRKGDTPYLRWGDWFGFGVMLVLIGAAMGVSRFGRRDQI